MAYLYRIRVFLVGLVLMVLLVACTVIDLNIDESYTVTCPVGETATWEVLDDGIVVKCNNNSDTQTVVTCYDGQATVTQVDPATVRVDCTDPTTTTTTSTTTTTVPTTTTTTIPSEPAIWHGDADNDIDHGAQTNCIDKNTGSLPTDRLSIVPDPQGLYGDVYKAELLATDSGRRAEWKDPYLNCDGSTEVYLWEGVDQVRYIGWRSFFGDGVNLNGDGNYLQWKGNSSCGGPAVGMTLKSGRLTLRTLDGADPNDPTWQGVDDVWVDSLLLADRLNVWTDFVMRVNMSKTTGTIQWWVNGQPQILIDGTTQFEGPTVCPNDARVWTKWGVYSMNDGNPTHYLESPRIGTSYESVAP